MSRRIARCALRRLLPPVAAGIACAILCGEWAAPASSQELTLSPRSANSHSLNADDSWVVDFGGGGMNGTVWVLYEHGGMLFAGGEFTAAGQSSANHVAAFDGSNWSPLAAGTDGRVFSLLRYRGDLVVGGEFTMAGGLEANYIARWDGSAWHTLAGGVDGAVRAMAIFDGDLIVGGDFTLAGGVSADKIARWDGESWSSMGSGFAGGFRNLGVRSLEVSSGNLFAGGFFVRSGATSMDFVAAWSERAQHWGPVASGLPGVGYALRAHAGRLYAGSVVWFPGTGTWADVFRVWPGGWKPLGSGTLSEPFPNAGRAFAVRGGRLIAVGQFRHAANVPVNYVAKWDGATWHGYGSGANAPVYAVAVFRGNLYVGGEFSAIGGKAASRLARWEGAPDNAFHASDLLAETQSSGVRVSWHLDEDTVAELNGVRVQRRAANHIYVNISPRLTPSHTMSYTDVDADPAGSHTYRLAFHAVHGPPSTSETVSSHRRGQPPGGVGHHTISWDEGGAVRFTFRVSGAETPTRIALYNARGQLVRDVLHRTYSRGVHSFVWDQNSGLGNGVYFASIEVGGRRSTEKLVLLRD